MRYRSPVKKQKVQYAPRSRSSSRRKTVSARGGVPVGDDRAVVPADDEVGALALADLVADDRLDDLGVVGVAGRRSRRGRRTRRATSGSAASRSSTDTSCSASMSTTVSGVPSSMAAKPRSRTCRNGTATSRSALRPGSADRSRAGCRAGSPPRGACRRSVPRSGAALRRMTAHAPCPWICSRRSADGGGLGHGRNPTAGRGSGGSSLSRAGSRSTPGVPRHRHAGSSGAPSRAPSLCRPPCTRHGAHRRRGTGR